jgi:hypothetical protein
VKAAPEADNWEQSMVKSRRITARVLLASLVNWTVPALTVTVTADPVLVQALLASTVEDAQLLLADLIFKAG